MTRYAELKALVQKWRDESVATNYTSSFFDGVRTTRAKCADELEAALALPEDSKTGNAELYGLAVELADKFVRIAPNGGFTGVVVLTDNDLTALRRYLSLREQPDEPMPYRVVRDGDKVRFDVPAPPKDGV